MANASGCAARRADAPTPLRSSASLLELVLRCLLRLRRRLRCLGDARLHRCLRLVRLHVRRGLRGLMGPPGTGATFKPSQVFRRGAEMLVRPAKVCAAAVGPRDDSARARAVWMRRRELRWATSPPPTNATQRRSSLSFSSSSSSSSCHRHRHHQSSSSVVGGGRRPPLVIRSSVVGLRRSSPLVVNRRVSAVGRRPSVVVDLSRSLCTLHLLSLCGAKSKRVERDAQRPTTLREGDGREAERAPARGSGGEKGHTRKRPLDSQNQVCRVAV